MAHLVWRGPLLGLQHRALPTVAGANIAFVRGDARPVHEAMAHAAGAKNIWLTGGGDLVGTFADHGLLDEVIIGVAPVTLGAGAPLLPRRLLSDRLALIGVERVGQFAYLTYAVRHRAASGNRLGAAAYRRKHATAGGKAGERQAGQVFRMRRQAAERTGRGARERTSEVEVDRAE